MKDEKFSVKLTKKDKEKYWKKFVKKVKASDRSVWGVLKELIKRYLRK